MVRNKISVIGAGNVGATVAQFIASKELGDVYLFDVVDGVPEGKSLDIFEGTPHWGSDVDVKGMNTKNPETYGNLEDSDVVVITAGFGRRPGMSRNDLLGKNVEIMTDVAKKVKEYASESKIIVVSNPADIMAYAFQKISGIDPQHIMGLGGALDSSRFRAFIASELNVSVEDVSAFVIGGHGDDMIPLIRYSNVAGIPITNLISKEKIDEIVQRTRFGGGEILNYLKTGGAYYAPGIAITVMVESIVKDKHRVIPCAAYLDGEHAKHYGAEGIFIGVPISIGRNGVERIFDIDFTEEEKALWRKTLNGVLDNCREVDNFLNSERSV